MPHLEILGSGRIDERESAFPQAIQLPNGDVLCSFSVGGGAHVAGGSDWARSTDGGLTWTLEGTILPKDEVAGWANALKLSYAADLDTIYAYGSRISHDVENAFGDRPTSAIICRSTDQGRTWTPASEVPFPAKCPLEVSHGILPLAHGRALAPAATLPDQGRLGEEVVVAITDDRGQHWPRHAVTFRDPAGERAFFEHKFAVLDDGRIMATAWTASMGDYVDGPNHFALSSDQGETWGPAVSTGIQGQTMTPVPLGGDRLLVLYNRRYGDQAVVMCLVTFTDTKWTIHHEGLLYDAQTHHQRSAARDWASDELAAFAFGFPTALPLADGSFLATHWCVEGGRCGIRWTKLSVEW